ncbi:beta-lactamase/transpeptidase-like protein [Xylariaceae sp. FL0255]|nr:beta-lactamase/transpeptidase-like protein [Xylariaceae sp. FL0255]
MDKDSSSAPDLKERLQEALGKLEKIKNLCRVPSISVGVIHEGNIVFQDSIGLRDVENDQRADERTVHLLASSSKMFLAAAVTILVSEGVMSWDDPIRKHVPDFDPVNDPDIGEHATIRNALSHTSGLGKAQTVCWGPNGCSIVDESSFIECLNHASARAHGEDVSRFPKKQFYYNNQAYGAVALALQNSCGRRYADFVKERIFDPLGMKDTITDMGDLENHPNAAHGYVTLEDGSFAQVESSLFTDNKNSPTLAAVGIRSSIKDMLIWCAALLNSQGENTMNIPAVRELSEIWKPQAEIMSGLLQYCLGWYRGHLPSYGLGGIGLNYRTRNHDLDFYEREYVLGRDSPRLDFIGHCGNASGFASSIHVFPATSSAIVAMTNGLNGADAADFAVQLFTQALFDLKPSVQILQLAEEEMKHYRWYYEDMVMDWLKFRDISSREPDVKDFVGIYKGFGIHIDVFVREETGRLALTFNSLEKSMCDLEFYSKNNKYEVYSFFPLKRDEWLSRAMTDWDDFRVGLFYFSRKSDSRKVNCFAWLYEPGEPMAWFYKSDEQSKPNSSEMTAPLPIGPPNNEARLPRTSVQDGKGSSDEYGTWLEEFSGEFL